MAICCHKHSHHDRKGKIQPFEVHKHYVLKEFGKSPFKFNYCILYYAIYRSLRNLYLPFFMSGFISVHIQLQLLTFPSFIYLIGKIQRITVEMVLVGMSSSFLDLIWIGCFTIWRYKGNI